jgi:outer membrane protein OmpA-like peptidoglycan-associated protein
MFIFITSIKKHIDCYFTRRQQMSLVRYTALLYFTFSFLIAFAAPLKSSLPPAGAEPWLLSPPTTCYKINTHQKASAAYLIGDSLPLTKKNTVVIPFEFKQSALFQLFTFKAIDSVVDILLKNDSVKISIEGYAHVEEGIDSICYYLSLNRALVIRDYVLGRGIDSSRIKSLTAFGNIRSLHRKPDVQMIEYNCRAEILMIYPIPPPKPVILDKDEDGIADNEDACPDEYGELVYKGCPNKDAIIVPFEPQQSSLYSIAYNVLDTVISVLRKDPSITITIEGYAYKKEGINTYCNRLAKDRADIVREYILSRLIAASRINTVKSKDNLRPLNAGKNPKEISRNSRAEIYLNRH